METRMKQVMQRRGVLQAGLALGASLVLPPARACEFFSSTLRVTHPWTRVTPQDAAFAIVSMKIDQVIKADRLMGVDTPVAAGAEVISLGIKREVNVLLPRDQETVLGENSAVQLRLVRLTQPLLIARTYPMRLLFEQGGWLDAELNIDFQPND